MNGVHDMGGMDGFGRVEPEPNEPVFHSAWEARVLALQRAVAATGAFNIDAGRYARELLPPHISDRLQIGLEGLDRHAKRWVGVRSPELARGKYDRIQPLWILAPAEYGGVGENMAALHPLDRPDAPPRVAR